MSERKRIQVETVGTPKEIGKGTKVEFKGKDGVVYEFWESVFAPFIQAGKEIDAEIEYSEKQGTSAVFKHYKVVQLYIDGKPVLEGGGRRPGGGGSFGPRGKSSEEIASEDARAAFAGIVEMIKAGIQIDVLGKKTPAGLTERIPISESDAGRAALAWAVKKLNADLTKKPAAPKEQPGKSAPATATPVNGKSAAAPDNGWDGAIDKALAAPAAFENLGQMLTKAKEILDMNKTTVLSYPDVAKLIDERQYTKAFALLTEIKAKEKK